MLQTYIHLNFDNNQIKLRPCHVFTIETIISKVTCMISCNMDTKMHLTFENNHNWLHALQSWIKYSSRRVFSPWLQFYHLNIDTCMRIAYIDNTYCKSFNKLKTCMHTYIDNLNFDDNHYVVQVSLKIETWIQKYISKTIKTYFSQGVLPAFLGQYLFLDSINWFINLYFV